MRHLRSAAFRSYLIGFACLLIGAWVSGELHSMLPLAMGSAAAVLGTVSLVREIGAAGRKRRSQQAASRPKDI